MYLYQRNLKELVHKFAMKCDIEPTRIVRVVRVNPPKLLQILMDDEAVLEMPEGQDMFADFLQISSTTPLKREWEAGPTDVQTDSEIPVETVQSVGYELRLIY